MNATARTKLIKGDALEFLRSLRPASIDLIVSSPPYFMGKEYDSSVSIADFESVHRSLLDNLVRVLKPGGSLCWQVGHHVQRGVCVPLDALVYAVFSKAPALILRNRIVWTFGHGVHAQRRFSGRHESILWYSKGSEYYFDLDAVRVSQKYPGKRHYKGPNKGEWSGNPLGKNPSDVWDIPNVKAGHVEKTPHPCQFPVALVQRLIRALCPKVGVVADPFMGSGTSAVAAALEGRRFLGCEREPRYFELASNRIKHLRQGTLRYRPLDRPIHIPSTSTAVATKPPHFAS